LKENWDFSSANAWCYH